LRFAPDNPAARPIIFALIIILLGARRDAGALAHRDDVYLDAPDSFNACVPADSSANGCNISRLMEHR
jgi:hypothetical protein